MGVMESVVRSMKPERREAMMTTMMPAMMSGLKIDELMPKMMGAMLDDVSADDVAGFLRNLLKDREKLAALLDSVRETQPMAKMMFKVYRESARLRSHGVGHRRQCSAMRLGRSLRSATSRPPISRPATRT
jgi:hypothetical protein